MMLPLVMVTTGTLAVTRVPWAPSHGHDDQVLATAADTGSVGRAGSPHAAGAPAEAPQDQLRDRLITTLQTRDPGAALDQLASAMRTQPSLTRYCTGIARDLGRAAVKKYDGNVRRALSYARPVCDGSFAAGSLGG